MGKLHTLLASQVCMCGNPSLPPRRPSAFHANQASELAAYDLARQQCEGDEMSQQLQRALPGFRRKGKITSFCQSENLFVWLMDGAQHKQRLCKIDWADESKAAWRRSPRLTQHHRSSPSHVSWHQRGCSPPPPPPPSCQRRIRTQEQVLPWAGSQVPLKVKLGLMYQIFEKWYERETMMRTWYGKIFCQFKSLGQVGFATAVSPGGNCLRLAA